jgi:hypothetical protein
MKMNGVCSLHSAKSLLEVNRLRTSNYFLKYFLFKNILKKYLKKFIFNIITFK